MAFSIPVTSCQHWPQLICVKWAKCFYISTSQDYRCLMTEFDLLLVSWQECHKILVHNWQCDRAIDEAFLHDKSVQSLHNLTLCIQFLQRTLENRKTRGPRWHICFLNLKYPICTKTVFNLRANISPSDTRFFCSIQSPFPPCTCELFFLT